MDTLQIKRLVSDSDLFIILLNIYNLGYTKVLLFGELKNLLQPLCFSFLTSFSKEIHTYLGLQDLKLLPSPLLSKSLKGIIYNSTDTSTLQYFKNTYKSLEFIQESI